MTDWQVAKRAVKHRYVIRENANASWEERYALFDTLLRRVIMRTSSYRLAISAAQRRNGFSPVDGDERTYMKQMENGNEKRN